MWISRSPAGSESIRGHGFTATSNNAARVAEKQKVAKEAGPTENTPTSRLLEGEVRLLGHVLVYYDPSTDPTRPVARSRRRQPQMRGARMRKGGFYLTTKDTPGGFKPSLLIRFYSVVKRASRFRRLPPLDRRQVCVPGDVRRDITNDLIMRRVPPPFPPAPHLRSVPRCPFILPRDASRTYEFRRDVADHASCPSGGSRNSAGLGLVINRGPRRTSRPPSSGARLPIVIIAASRFCPVSGAGPRRRRPHQHLKGWSRTAVAWTVFSVMLLVVTSGTGSLITHRNLC